MKALNVKSNIKIDDDDGKWFFFYIYIANYAHCLCVKIFFSELI